MIKDYEWKNNLRFVRIYFSTPTFDRIEKDRAAKFVDMLSAIGGTMGLGHMVTWSLGHSVIRSLGHLVTWSLGHSVTRVTPSLLFSTLSLTH